MRNPYRDRQNMSPHLSGRLPVFWRENIKSIPSETSSDQEKDHSRDRSPIGDRTKRDSDSGRGSHAAAGEGERHFGKRDFGVPGHEKGSLKMQKRYRRIDHSSPSKGAGLAQRRLPKQSVFLTGRHWEAV